RVLDPACGTGGFLITAMNNALADMESIERESWGNPDQPTSGELEELFRKRNVYLTQNVHGLDLNPALVRAAKMNMIMNNDGDGGLYQADSLANPHTWDDEPRKRIGLASVHVLFTNPPFGANII